MTNFDQYKRLFDTDDLGTLTRTAEGLLWLKLKSLSRVEFLDPLWNDWGLPPVKKTSEKFRRLFTESVTDTALALKKVDTFIRSHMSVLSEEREESLVSELYKVRHFDWGGDYKNALDKYLVDRYVKEYSSFDTITDKLETEIPRAVYGYVICSWYNHWSTILIENIFKKHPKVLPALGKIKKVDFFLDDVPFDLKVTYLPVNFVECCRKERGMKSEVSELKAAAKRIGIPFAANGRQKDIQHELVERLRDSSNPLGKQTVDAVYSFRRELTQHCIADPKPLLQNLYEEQGEMRFDASNRLFLILVDETDFDASWKLKRNVELLTSAINAYVDGFNRGRVEQMKVSFSHKAKPGVYQAISDAVFVVRS
ncbi:MAG: hypothetical protein IT445_10045 [Phycisphaeraceae bacterium]|nr:hypothetical protein [Phycisphaeraceae bacterium]